MPLDSTDRDLVVDAFRGVRAVFCRDYAFKTLPKYIRRHVPTDDGAATSPAGGVALDLLPFDGTPRCDYAPISSTTIHHLGPFGEPARICAPRVLSQIEAESGPRTLHEAFRMTVQK